MDAIIGEFRIGEDLAVALDAVEGNAASAGSVSAVMRAAIVASNGFEIDQAAPTLSMTVAPQSPASAGWILSLGNAQTAALQPGIYAIDARLTVGSAVEITDQTAFVRLSQASLA